MRVLLLAKWASLADAPWPKCDHLQEGRKKVEEEEKEIKEEEGRRIKTDVERPRNHKEIESWNIEEEEGQRKEEATKKGSYLPNRIISVAVLLPVSEHLPADIYGACAGHFLIWVVYPLTRYIC